MVDDDKKKDLDNEYSALSDALESGDPAPSLEDLLKSHGIDLGSDMDLEAMQDFSFSEQASHDQEKSQESADKDLFNEHLFDDHLFDEPPIKSSSGRDFPDEHLFDDNLFDEPVEPLAPPVRPTRASEPIEPDVSDTTIFESSDFDDVNAGGDVDLGNDPLFDYDPQAEATFADVGSAEADMGGDDGGMNPPPPEKHPGAKRILVRLVMMLGLISVFYGGLRYFLGESTPETVAQAPATNTPPSQIASLSAPQPVTNAAPTPAPTPEAPTPEAMAPEATAPAATAPEVTPPAATTAEMAASTSTQAPSSLPVPGAVSSGLPETTPVVTAATTETAAAAPTNVAAAPAANSNTTMMHEAVTSPTTSLNVAVPLTSMTGNEKTASSSTPSKITMGSGDVNDKLDNLELALQSIDQRLSQVSSGGVGDDKIQRLERLVNDSSAPEMQDVLKQAVNKMRELDRKLERISELQQQVRMLDTDVKMLKEDVETQTNMVGEQQRLFNDNIQLAQMAEPGPVKMIVQAAIPGRAWLRSERGELLTVIPGDEVPGYGRVVSIDAASGTVVTSSRAVFREQ